MTMHVNVGGTWKAITDAHVNVGGTWKRLLEGYVNVGGTWKKFWEYATFFVSTDTVFDQTVGIGFSSAEIQYQSDGNIVATTTTNGAEARGDWVTPTSFAPGAYTIRASLVSGSAPFGPALDTDHALSSTRSWNVIDSGGGAMTSTITITIKDGSGNVKASGDIGLSAQAL
jgi:hypothetical protein